MNTQNQSQIDAVQLEKQKRAIINKLAEMERKRKGKDNNKSPDQQFIYTGFLYDKINPIRRQA